MIWMDLYTLSYIQPINIKIKKISNDLDTLYDAFPSPLLDPSWVQISQTT
jgi:hypothetical protein